MNNQTLSLLSSDKCPTTMSRLGPVPTNGRLFPIGETLPVINTYHETWTGSIHSFIPKWEDAKQKEAGLFVGAYAFSPLILNGPQAITCVTAALSNPLNGWVILNNEVFSADLQNWWTNTPRQELRKNIQELYTAKYIRAIYIEKQHCILSLFHS